MADFIETLKNTPLLHIFIVVAIALVAHYFSRRSIDKMEKKLFGEDAERFRADKNGVSPFDRPPVGFDEQKAKEADALSRAKEGSTTEPVVSEIKRD